MVWGAPIRAQGDVHTIKTGVPANDVMSIGFIPSSLKYLANPKSASLICAAGMSRRFLHVGKTSLVVNH